MTPGIVKMPLEIHPMNLSKDDALDPVEHPELDYFFDSFKDGLYHRRRSSN